MTSDQHPEPLAQLVRRFADALMTVDSRRPVAVRQTTGTPFQAGIGPHTETATVALVMQELKAQGHVSAHQLAVAYPHSPRQKCDVCLGASPRWNWALEVKLLRLMGDNGRPNDNMLMHILSPYPAHRSALTDCAKLATSGFDARKGIVIYGFEHEEWPLAPAIDAFETLARAKWELGPRHEARLEGLVHPVHASGAVFGWELRT
jgi:hypothetical protein